MSGSDCEKRRLIAFLADEDLNGNIVDGLRESQPPVKLVTVKEAGLISHPDSEILEWAAAQGRVVVSSDENTMIAEAYERVRRRLPMPGVIIVPQDYSIGAAIEDLALIGYCGDPMDLTDQVRFIHSI